MEIIIDVIRLLRRLKKGRTLTGIDRVTMAYVQHYRLTAHALVRFIGRSWVLPHSQSKALFMWIMAPRSVLDLAGIIARGLLASTWIKKPENAFLLNTWPIGLHHSDYLRMIQKFGVRPIFFVHDLIPIIYPEYCSAGEDARHKEKMHSVLTLACGVITNSEATLSDLVHYSQQINQTMPRAEVALLAPGISRVLPGARPIEQPYFIILGTIEPRKNHALLLQIWRSMVQQLGQQTPHLLVIGQRGWECENAIDLLERSQFLKGVVTEISHCPDAELVTYLHHSQALLFPSFTEGYGLPVLEALTLGVPVIASDLSVFREIAGDIAEYIDPLDAKRWAEQIIEYAKPHSVCRAVQMQRLQSFKGPTWAQHFTKIDSFLANLKNEPRTL